MLLPQPATIFSQMFASMEDDYMRERAADVKDISERILAILGGGSKSTVNTEEPVIILADDLAPSETVQLDKDKVLSFVTVHGSVNSHTAILARTMGIPALIGTSIPLDDQVDGKLAVVDGANGMIYVDPDRKTLSEMQRRQQEEEEKKELLQQLKGKENITLDGKKVMLYANIGNIKDLPLLYRMTPAESGCSEANSSILRKRITPQRRNSLRYTKRLPRPWQETCYHPHSGYRC